MLMTSKTGTSSSSSCRVRYRLRARLLTSATLTMRSCPPDRIASRDTDSSKLYTVIE